MEVDGAVPLTPPVALEVADGAGPGAVLAGKPKRKKEKKGGKGSPKKGKDKNRITKLKKGKYDFLRSRKFQFIWGLSAVSLLALATGCLCSLLQHQSSKPEPKPKKKDAKKAPAPLSPCLGELHKKLDLGGYALGSCAKLETDGKCTMSCSKHHFRVTGPAVVSGDSLTVVSGESLTPETSVTLDEGPPKGGSKDSPSAVECVGGKITQAPKPGQCFQKFPAGHCVLRKADEEAALKTPHTEVQFWQVKSHTKGPDVKDGAQLHVYEREHVQSYISKVDHGGLTPCFCQRTHKTPAACSFFWSPLGDNKRLQSCDERGRKWNDAVDVGDIWLQMEEKGNVLRLKYGVDWECVDKEKCQLQLTTDESANTVRVHPKDAKAPSMGRVVSFGSSFGSGDQKREDRLYFKSWCQVLRAAGGGEDNTVFNSTAKNPVEVTEIRLL